MPVTMGPTHSLLSLMCTTECNVYTVDYLFHKPSLRKCH